MPSPVNTIAPEVLGSTTVTYLLTVTLGAWTNSPTSYSYQWTKNGTNISGQTGMTYQTVSPGDVGANITCIVTATNASGSGSATAPAVVPVAGMVITNISSNPSEDYWFGPRKLPAGGSLTLDDTSDTSIYLSDDAVAYSVNTLLQAGKISVSGAAAPFPRPTGAPALLHGDGSPQGKVYAGQGSTYLRRDNTGGSTAVYAKTSGVTYDVGWAAIVDPWVAYDQSLGLQASTFPLFMANHSSSPTQKQALACGVWLNAGTVINGLVVNYVATTASLTQAFLGIYNASYQLQAITSDAHLAFGSTAGWIKVLLSPTPYVVPLTGLYYFAAIFIGTTTPTITSMTGAGSQASQPNPSGQYAYFEGSGTGDSTLNPTASPSLTALAPWIGAY